MKVYEQFCTSNDRSICDSNRIRSWRSPKLVFTPIAYSPARSG
ncbi:hypothetical protein [Argonema galeatum]|nr:hypothetical protein [Argonema galeatum]